MDNILYTIICVWSFFSVFWLISFLSFFRKKTKISDGGECGRNIRIEKKWDGSYDVSSTSNYSGPIYEVEYNALGIFFKGIGTGGIACIILLLLKDYITELTCMCTLGMIDVRENQVVVYGCILGIATISALIAGFGAWSGDLV
ncbi:MAG: hypothetical protein IJA34_13125 [Lachnospiraceae bacterium]|nr:hypothetical protein [Lachnospiraceae bacterium]